MYRICTEDVNRPRIEAIIAQHGIEGYAMLTGTGYWKGQKELALTLEFIGANRETIRAIAEEIRTANKQEAVLVQHIPVEAELV